MLSIRYSPFKIISYISKMSTKINSIIATMIYVMVQRFFVFWDDCGLIWLGIINKRVQTTMYNPPIIPFRYFEQYNNNNIKQNVVA